jgi:membrane associated rhomboid family serine protease
MAAGDHDVMKRGHIFDDREITLDWYSNSSHAQSGNFSVVYENHNAVSAAQFEAFVSTDTYYDIGRLNSVFSYPLLAIRHLLKSASNAYSTIRPASCRASAQSDLTLALVQKCNTIVSSYHLPSLLIVCSTLSGGHLALVLIVVLNVLCYHPSLRHQGWWALSSSSPNWRTLFTHQFAHANDQHIVGNMLTLLFVGTEVSESLNCDLIFFILFYLLCGLAGGMFAVWFSPHNVRTVGASGSVSGIIVALSVLRPNAAVTILGDVNASNPIMLLAGTLLADLQRLGVSWQVFTPFHT